jgi:hypothetical protein
MDVSSLAAPASFECKSCRVIDYGAVLTRFPQSATVARRARPLLAESAMPVPMEKQALVMVLFGAIVLGCGGDGGGAGGGVGGNAAAGGSRTAGSGGNAGRGGATGGMAGGVAGGMAAGGASGGMAGAAGEIGTGGVSGGTAGAAGEIGAGGASGGTAGAGGLAAGGASGGTAGVGGNGTGGAAAGSGGGASGGASGMGGACSDRTLPPRFDCIGRPQSSCGACLQALAGGDRVCACMTGTAKTNCQALLTCMSPFQFSCVLDPGLCYCTGSSCSSVPNGPCAPQFHAVAGTTDPAVVLQQLQDTSSTVARVVDEAKRFANTAACGMYCGCL